MWRFRIQGSKKPPPDRYLEFDDKGVEVQDVMWRCMIQGSKMAAPEILRMPAMHIKL